jgi:hypothetical protein
LSVANTRQNFNGFSIAFKFAANLKTAVNIICAFDAFNNDTGAGATSLLTKSLPDETIKFQDLTNFYLKMPDLAFVYFSN